MAKRYRLGVALMSHDHLWGELTHWRRLDNVELVAAADDESVLREKLRSLFSSARLYESWREMLETEELDVLQVAGGNSEAAEIVEAAAGRGIHVCSEKPMAATLEQAVRMAGAAERAGTRLLINWPTAWSPHWQELERRVLAGQIGALRYTRYRAAHDGPIAIGCSSSFVRDLTDPAVNGAGSLMDYCCYGADLAARFLGRPQAVTGMRGFFGAEAAYAASDDNALIIARFPNAFGLCEASWSQPAATLGANPVLYGSEGAIGVLGDHVVLRRVGHTEEQIVPPKTVFPRRSGPEYLLHCIAEGIPVEGFCAPEVSRNAQEILEAGLRAADTGVARAPTG